jgi:hypothetical protein
MMQRVVGAVVVLAIAAGALFAIKEQTQPKPVLQVPTGNIRDHGARGDGGDDTQAIQSAINAAPLTGIVHFPKGQYRITRTIVIDLTKTGFIALRGDGVASVVMSGAGPAFKFIGTHAGSADPKTVKDAVWAGERMPSVDGLEIVGDHENADAVEASGTMQLTITRVLIRKCRHGIHLTNRNRNVAIADCHIYQNRGIGVFLDAVNLHQTNVTGCHISYCDGGGIVCRAGEVRNLQVTGCDIESNQGEKSEPTANVFIDSTGGSTAEVAITGNTIQHNHNAAGSANIRVRGPSVRVMKGVEEQRDGHVTITGNVISDVKVNVHLDHARGVVIAGNTFWTAYEHNVLAEHSSFVTVGANNFDRNPRYGSEEKPSTTNDIIFRDCSDCTLSGFTLSRTRSTPAGVTLEKCDRFNVGNLTILDCDGVGLLLKGLTNSRVAGCVIRDDRPNASSISLRTEGGRANMIVDNYLGRPSDILKGIGLVERNYDGNRP